jgi:hypothetical protein
MTLNSIFFIGCLLDEIKLMEPNASFMGFYFFLKIVYIRFHLDKAPFSLSLYFFCHVIKQSYVVAHLLKIKLSLRVA